MKLTFEYLLLKSILNNEIRLSKTSSISLQVENEVPYLIWKENSEVKRIIDITKYLWGSTEDMFYTLIFSEMTSQGYFLAPIDNGFLCINPLSNEYQISVSPYQCSCGNYHWKHRNDSGSCKHILMLKGHLLLKQRAASYLSSRFSS